MPQKLIIIFIETLADIIMRKQSPTKQPFSFSFQKNWQEIAKIQASLGKVLRRPESLTLNQDQLEIIVNASKKLLKAIDVLRHEQKHQKGQQESYNLMIAKMSNHQTIINNIEKGFNQRCKSLMEETRLAKDQMEKLRKSNQEIEEQCKITSNTLKYQRIQLEENIENLNRTKERLLQELKSKDTELRECYDSIKRLKGHLETIEEMPPKDAVLNSVLCSELSSKIVSYLTPYDAYSLRVLNKQIRLYVIKSKLCGDAVAQSMRSVKERQLNYFHQHIEYFERRAHKIPQQILHSTFYHFHIAKEPIGPQILAILNSSAGVFEGKWQEDNQDSYQEAASEASFNKAISLAGSNYLEVDQGIIREYIEEKKTERDKAMKDIDLMYKKIQGTAQLYSADVEGIGIFLKNILKNFSKIFVLSKNLYSQARNLQFLNQFLLSELVEWDKMDIKSISKIEDLKAELQAEKSLKLFFTDKSQKSEKKALSEQNSKLNIEMKCNQTLNNYDILVHEKTVLESKLEQTQKNFKTMTQQNRQLKKAYETGKERYHQIIQELSVVKQTIIRMNLL